MYVAALFVSDCESGVREEDNTSIRRRHGKGYPERSQSSRETLQTRNTQEYRLRVPARQVIDVAIFSRYGVLRPRFRRLDSTPLDSRSGTKTAAPHGNRTLKDENDTNMGRYGGPHQGSCIHSFTRPCPQGLETSQQYPISSSVLPKKLTSSSVFRHRPGLENRRFWAHVRGYVKASTHHPLRARHPILSLPRTY